ncbi:hypothetical protein J4H92_14355 [Leucobacter weissii]|uniref:Isochorismatase family protein n=1 Tax=Leucobacter weissii TaxID=1983706 RepID=A0A939MLE0_9MICO|nr:hypothetical protein [Leucobacter weissii]MBO1903123.1 hypothetical protein [Leucobacter weissii]
MTTREDSRAMSSLDDETTRPDHLAPRWDTAALLLIDLQRDFRTVLATDAVSQTTPERLSDLAAIGVQLIDVAGIRVALGPSRVAH